MGRRRILLSDEPVDSLAAYEAAGGGAGLRTLADHGPDRILDELEASGLRGRGGAGFPTGLKWRSIVAGGPAAGERFVVANGAEGEPGTFKDRFLVRNNPYSMLEGLAVSAGVTGARRAYVAVKSSFAVEIARLSEALVETAEAGWWPDVEVSIVGGPEEYLFGEEKALLEVIEGEDPLPRQFPPYVYGLFTTSPQMGWSAGQSLERRDEGANPTLVNNVETLANVPAIVSRGAEWFRSIGTSESPGTVLCTISGDTARHGVEEFEMGTPVGEIIETIGGGVAGGRIRSLPALRRVQPGAPRRPFGHTGVSRGALRCRRRTRHRRIHRVRRPDRSDRTRSRRFPFPVDRIVRTMPGVQTRNRTRDLAARPGDRHEAASTSAYCRRG